MKFLNKNVLILLIALVLGVFAAYTANSYINKRISSVEAALKLGEGRTRVVVAKQDLPRGTLITPEVVAVRNIPKKYTHADGITPETFDAASNQHLAFPVRAGEELLWAQLEDGKTPTFSARVSKGFRALTFQVDEINSISGMLQPGDKIDLIATLKKKVGDKEKEVTFPLLQNVLVVATGQQVGRDNGNADGTQAKRSYSTITLQVDPDNAKRIIIAHSAGTLTAVLRNPDDSATIPADKMDVAMLLGGGQSAHGHYQQAVEIISGGQGGRGSHH